ncbi:hypothetical protein D3C76_1003620 [compost metagenome]
MIVFYGITDLSDSQRGEFEDSAYIAFSAGGPRFLLFAAPERGQDVEKIIDLEDAFGSASVHISELMSIDLYQRPMPHPVAKDDWQLASVSLVVNDEFTNDVFKGIAQWISSPNVNEELVWSRPVPWAGWRNSAQRPIDFNCETYPVTWLPYIADVYQWRSYDPSTIEGVGQLIGMQDGVLVGQLLKSRQCHALAPNGENDSYTWVFKPDGSIIYRLWNHRERRDSYVRHSQLASGEAVICAGELRLEWAVGRYGLSEVVALINDASGHYKPDGGACLVHVLRKLQHLGVSTDRTQLSWRARSP